jgi:XisI protein
MDRLLSYADILKQTLQEATKAQPRLQAIKLYPVCDKDSGHFLIIATGWDKQRWIDAILFHARLVDRHVIIEEDNFEEGLTSALIAAGIQAEHIVTSLDYQSGASPVFQAV